MDGYYHNSSNTCTDCNIGDCEQCFPFANGFQCLDCLSPHVLTQDFTCQFPCLHPCATCSIENPNSCISCVQGYTMTSGSCVADTTCNTGSTCLVCPFGFSINSVKTTTRINQTCDTCDAASNCARCNLTNTAQCFSCPTGMYLNGTICSTCA